MKILAAKSQYKDGTKTIKVQFELNLDELHMLQLEYECEDCPKTYMQPLLNATQVANLTEQPQRIDIYGKITFMALRQYATSQCGDLRTALKAKPDQEQPC